MTRWPYRYLRQDETIGEGYWVIPHEETVPVAFVFRQAPPGQLGPTAWAGYLIAEPVAGVIPAYLWGTRMEAPTRNDVARVLLNGKES